MNKIEERKNHIRILTETYSTPDDPFTYQPHIIAVGNYLKPTQFVCYFNNVTYIFDEFLQALDCTFKVIFVYNYIYPPECRPLWQFIQQNFYKIKLREDKNFQTLKQANLALQ